MANEKRLIDAVELRNTLYDADAITMKGVAIINQFPTVDAAEVVRCKDCKHWSMGYCNHFAYYSYEPITHEEDFCSYGERR